MNRFHGATTLLVVCSLLNGCQTSPAPEELEAFERRVLDEYLAFEKAQEPSEQNGLTMRDYYERVADPELNPRAEAIDWLVELEAEHRGTQAGLDALDAALGHLRRLDYHSGEFDHLKPPAIYDLLVDHYTHLEGLGEVCYHGSLHEDRDDFLMTMDLFIAKSPHRTVQARAIAAKMLVFMSIGQFDEQVECAELLMESYAEVSYQNTPCGELAEECLMPPFAESLLQVGSTPPDLAGYDLDGNPVALGDLRGKVVVMTFFGFWCIYCRDLVPVEKALAEKLQGEPFTFLWLISDGSVEETRARLDRHGIDWPHMFMPFETRNPLSLQWGINEWPTTFVLDREGVIRFRGNEEALGGEKLEQAVMSLL